VHVAYSFIRRAISVIGYKYDLASGVAALSLAAVRNDPHSVFATLVMSPLLANVPALTYFAQTCTPDVHGSGTPNDRVAGLCQKNWRSCTSLSSIRTSFPPFLILNPDLS
jgi:hypothetical protein